MYVAECEAQREKPALRATRLLGAKSIAHVCNLTTNAVWKWATNDEGLIPARYQRRILNLAGERGLTLTAEDVIGP